LATLPDREYRCGLGEIVKYALMGDAELLDIVAEHRDAIVGREPETLAAAVTRAAAVKARYVAGDETERTGLRAHLNYGHTLAHAIETVADHALAHGEAVAVGLVFAGALAGALERISTKDADRHRALVAGLGLPTEAPVGLGREQLVE